MPLLHLQLMQRIEDNEIRGKSVNEDYIFNFQLSTLFFNKISMIELNGSMQTKRYYNVRMKDRKTHFIKLISFNTIKLETVMKY